MMNGVRRLPVFVLPLLMVGCVERTVTINTEPEGATVILNDEEVGRSPVRVPFTWYGDYEIILRKEGYATVQTNEPLRAPWYQWPFIDLVSECLVPFTIYDEHVLDTFDLEPASPPSRQALLERATDMRSEALTEPM